MLSYANGHMKLEKLEHRASSFNSVI